MRLLLDTHILLWWLADSPQLSKNEKNHIANRENLIFISVVSAWEISIKKALGKLDAPDNLREALQANSFDVIMINLEHALLAGSLPRYHDDPFDRLIIAQCQLEKLTVITRDKHFELYGVNTL